MKRRCVKAIAAAMIMTLLSGCGNTASSNPETGTAQGKGDDQGAVGTGTEGGMAGTGDLQPAGDLSVEGGTGDDGSQAANGKPASADIGESQTDYIEQLYTQEENILSISDSAAAWGISYKIEKVEYTGSIGDRNLEHLEVYMPGAETDGQGNLSGDFKYLFLTITFTNTTDEAQEINRNAGGISVIGTSLNTVDWSNDVVYYDTYWEGGNSLQWHHWGLEPGESVTSEVGWLIGGCESMVGLDDSLGTSMGSDGPYELYYHVKQYDGDNEGSYFIDLGVKVE